MAIDMEHHFRDTEDLPKKMKLFDRRKDLLNEKVHFRYGITWIRADTFGSYIFKKNFDSYTTFREVNNHKDLKKKSSLTDDFDILRKLAHSIRKKLKTLRD
ncbi:hypothetical protein AVEN_71611-1 [Araneus ventricosus]|uniref:Uncharacterized protein n=1 Tax=Araneus ventricosus TaxID=182803 RepID=A0A4Y2F5A0_ARAVE|nr:hypothetical protein AVEN_71611-1 [Araneus ventricosus]